MRTHCKLAALCVGFALTAGAAHAEQLITAAEASLPGVPDTGMTTRGITRGPAVEQVSPAPDAKNLTSPMALNIKFEARNNATIDKDSVKVTYIRANNVDITARVKPFVTADGIDMKKAEVPPGTHLIRVDVKDSQGRASMALIKLSVDK
ncbi:MAG: hypothetical protein JO205_11110 [Pseudolabrys sp.]|nr:hypothetical protein [Pseudolabrys sp.]MBV9261909.1 hypothetical protein [Pseudolabrys sp.]